MIEGEDEDVLMMSDAIVDRVDLGDDEIVTPVKKTSKTSKKKPIPRSGNLGTLRCSIHFSRNSNAKNQVIRADVESFKVFASRIQNIVIHLKNPESLSLILKNHIDTVQVHLGDLEIYTSHNPDKGYSREVMPHPSSGHSVVLSFAE